VFWCTKLDLLSEVGEAEVGVDGLGGDAAHVQTAHHLLEADGRVGDRVHVLSWVGSQKNDATIEKRIHAMAKKKRKKTE